MKVQMPEAGEVHEVPFPFVRDKYTERNEDGVFELPTWVPGVRNVDRSTPYGERIDTIADGVGVQIITVVGVFKPGKFPLRVFYTRKWVDPSGKTFGKGCCRVTTIYAFRSLVNGYRHEFMVDPAQKGDAILATLPEFPR